MKAPLFLALLLFTSCDFTQRDYEKLPPLVSEYVEFLEFPKMNFSILGNVTYPVSVPVRIMSWDEHGQFAGSRMIVRTANIRLPEKVVAEYLQGEEDRRCFKYAVTQPSGKVGEAQFTPMDDCVKSIKKIRESHIKDEVYYNLHLWRRAK